MTNERLRTKRFEIVGGHPALDFVNTLDDRFRKSGSENLLKSYGDLLRFAAQAKVLSAADGEQLMQTVGKRAGEKVLASTIELREAIADVLYAACEERVPSASRMKTLERYFQEARHHQKLHWNISSAVWESPRVVAGAALPLWLLSLQASALLTSEAVLRVRDCENHECRWLFLDTSKNHTRRWCDMKLCGNRMKARRFKAQHDD